MTDRPHRFGIVGLGRMGGGLARHAIEKGFQLAGLTQGMVPADLLAAGLQETRSPEAFCAALPRRIVSCRPYAQEGVDVCRGDRRG